MLLLLSHFSRVRLCNPIDGSPPGSPHPWDSPGKNTGVGCHFLLQCMKVESESEVDIQVENKYIKRCSTYHHMSLGKCTLKQPCDTTTYLLEWPKSKTLTIPNAGEDVENQHSCSLLVGIKMVNYFGRQFGNIVLPQDPAT